jgi:2-methylcitrate dehydratase PrpD
MTSPSSAAFPGHTAALAGFAASLVWDDLPAGIVERLKECTLDFIGVAAFAAVDAQSSAHFREAVCALAGAGGASSVIGESRTYPPHYAALLNGAYGHTLDFDDTNQEGVLHPGVSVIPAALTASETADCDGRTFLAGLAAGYEVACRVGAALGPTPYDRGFHVTSVAGLFGAVAAAARIRGLDAAVTAHAFGLAGSRAAGSMQCLDNGAWNKRLHPGFAAHDALVCLALAQAGVAGASSPIEGRFGLLAGYSNAPDAARLTEALGERWLLQGTAFKPYPSCRMTHTAIDAVLALRGECSDADRPDAGFSVRLSPTALQIVGEPAAAKRAPMNIVEAQFSVQFQVAVAWLDGACDWSKYARIGDADVMSFARRVEVGADPTLPMAGADVELRLAGTSLRRRVPLALGEPSLPMGWKELRAKFDSLARPVFGAAHAAELVRRVRRLEHRASMADFATGLRAASVQAAAQDARSVAAL